MMNFFTKYVGVKNFIFFILAILFIILVTQIKDIAVLFFAAFVIACSLNPMVDKICKKFPKINRPSASVIILFGALSIAILFLIPIIITGGQQIGSFIETLPEKFEIAKTFLLNIPFLARTNLHNIDLGGIVAPATGFTSDLVNKSISLSKGLASFLIYFLAGCIIIYYFMADKDTIKKGYLSLFPKDLKEKADEIIESISQKVGGYVLAQVVTITSVGIIMLVGLLILGVDYAVILALIAAIFDLVPVAGPTVAFIIILIAVSKLSLIKIGLVILLFAFAQWAENNIVRPYVFGKLLNIHPLIIYFFLLITAQYLGIVGVIFAPAIAATACVLLEELYIKNINV